MNNNSNRNGNGNRYGKWAARGIAAARATLIVHAALFAAVNATFVMLNSALHPGFVEWSWAAWAVVLTVHAATVALACSNLRLRVRVRQLATAPACSN